MHNDYYILDTSQLKRSEGNRHAYLMRRLYKVAGSVAVGLFLLYTNGCVPPRTKTTAQVADTLVLGGLHFARIPGGSFAMGDNSSQAQPNEQPVHRVTISSFWMASTEITFIQWKNFLDESGYPVGRSKSKGGTHPVVGVTWDDAQAYCRWFSEKYSVLMRLPTEAEWEYAARGGLEGRQYPNGDTTSLRQANFASAGGSFAVGRYPPNGYGLYDMAGNVFEWTADWYDKDYYNVSPKVDPRGPATEDGKPQRHSDRGGGWCMGIEMIRVSARHAGPGSSDEGGTADCLGFRPVLAGSVKGR